MHYTTTPALGGKIKQRYMDFIVEEEYEKDHVAKLTIFSKKGIKQEKEITWPEGESKPHLHLVMEKYHLDTLNALRGISRYLGVSKSRIGYAGLKDKRGITAQRISIWKPELNRLKSFQSYHLGLYPIGFSDQKIEIGDLVGNQFTITIRNVQKSENEIKKIVEDFFTQAKNGLPNYFGEQRFGGENGVTAKVGKLFIKEKFEEAALLYLKKPLNGEAPTIVEKRNELIEEKKYLEALKLFEHQHRFERTILAHLHQHPRDFVGAFQKLPKTMRFLFVHAYQAQLFNEMMEERLKKSRDLKQPLSGEEVEEGEIVWPIFGFDSKIPGGVLGEMVEKILEKEEVQLSEFNVNAFREVSASGAKRALRLTPSHFKLLEITPDEFNEGKNAVTLSFNLPKGTYATVVLEELMKE